MKKLIACLALVASTATLADSIKIFELQSRRYSPRDVSVVYKLNPELGRAWVNVELTDMRGDDIDYDTHRVLVEGMSMNAEKTAVVMEANGRQVDCATVTPKTGRFGRSLLIINPTGACEFETKIVKRDVDDGFEIKSKTFVQVYLNLK